MAGNRMALRLDTDQMENLPDIPANNQLSPFSQILGLAEKSSPLSSQNLLTGSSDNEDLLTQSARQGYLRLTTGDAPLEEGFESIDEPDAFIKGGIRFITTTGRKFLVMESENSKAYAQVIAALQNKKSAQSLTQQGYAAPDTARLAPALGDVEGVEAIDDKAGTLVITSRDPETGEPKKSVYSAMTNKAAYLQARALASWINDASQEHRDTVWAYHDQGYTLVEDDNTSLVPDPANIRTLEYSTDADNNTITLLTTAENKRYVFSSVLSPKCTAELIEQIPSLQNIKTAQDKGFLLMKEAPGQEIEPTSVDTLKRNPETGAIAVKMYDGTQMLVDPNVAATRDIYAQLERVENFRAASPEHQKNVAEAATSGALVDTEKTTPPAFDSITSVNIKTQKDGEQTVLYTVRDANGTQIPHIASSLLTPQLVVDMAALEPAFLRMKELDGKKYIRPAANTPRPLPGEVENIVVDDKNQIVTWVQGGKNVALARAASPALYDDILKLKNFNALSFEYRDQFANSSFERLEALDSTPPPDASSISGWNIQETDEGGIITYEVKAPLKEDKPKNYIVSSVLAPQHYAKIHNILKGLEEIKKYEDQEYRHPTSADNADMSFKDVQLPDGPEGDIILATTLNDEKIVLHRGLDTILAAKALDFVNGKSKSELNIIKQQYGLPITDDMDIRQAKTNIRGSDNTMLTVTELAVRNIYENYQEQLKNGEIDSTDISNPKLQFIRLMEVQNDLANGHDFLPYYEDTTMDSGVERPGNNTVRKFADNMDEFSAADMHKLVDEQRHSQKLERLLAEDPTVQKDYDAALQSALENTDTSTLRNNLYSIITNPDLPAALKQAEDKGLGNALNLEISNYITSLAVLDPEQAQEAEEILQANSFVADMENELQEETNIDEITDVDVDRWAKDISKIFIDEISSAFDSDTVLAKSVTDGIKGAAALPRHTTMTFDTTWHETFKIGNRPYIEGLGKLEKGDANFKKSKFAEVVEATTKNVIASKAAEAIKIARLKGEKSINVSEVMRTITAEDVYKVVDGKGYVPWKYRSYNLGNPSNSLRGVGNGLAEATKGFFGRMQAVGLWGSLTGLAGLSVGIWKLADGRTQTTDERVSIARDFMTFFSVIGHVGNLTSELLDQATRFYNASVTQINEKAGTQLKIASQDYPLAWRLGLGLELGKVIFNQEASATPLLDRDGKTVYFNKDIYSQMKDRWGLSLEQRREAGIKDPDGKTQLLAPTITENGFKTSNFTRTLTASLKILGVVADYAGVIDIYLGLKDYQKATPLGDTYKQGVSVLRMVGGTSLTMAAASGTVAAGISTVAQSGRFVPAAKAATLASKAGFWTNLVHPLFWAGAVPSLIALIIDVGLDDSRGNPEKTEITLKDEKWWDQVDSLDVLEKNQKNMRSYGSTLLSTQNGRGAIPYNESIWDAQPDEFAYFENTPETNGSPTSRMNDELRK
jgi:hypothetical protein